MNSIWALYASLTVWAILVTAIIGYPIFTGTATAAFHEDSSTDSGTMNNATENGNLVGTTNDTGIAENDNATGARVEVAAGSNATVQYYTFSPETVEINAGESVTWSNPAEMSEIHTVTFVLDENLTSDLILPFAVPEGTDFELLPPFNVGEPIVIQTPDGKEAVIALNKHVFHPAVIDGNNETTFLNGTEIQYAMDGTEKALNSGIILAPFPPSPEESRNETAIGAAEIPPENNETGTATSNVTTAEEEAPPSSPEVAFEPPFPIVNEFTVTFEEPGTYPYFCAIHPWMSGQVIVNGGNATDTSASTPPPLMP
jgi:plastocyanin